ncbi:hypothetical protein BJY01DRAFT_255250 [Aspergillus pseudoustus]|uniref:Zn(2)-C6 fungal-type domain-containing protein n=1 Tax=Aspergillus pseudoustus TaxID=1810923 RepID=A0ABR4IM03_9EURO
MTSILPLATKRRRFHHKSRYGCTPCKKRKIKCDEKKPVCTSCSQRSVKCSFKDLYPALEIPELSTVAIAKPSKTNAIGVPAQVSGSGVILSFCRLGTRDLELYCHFQIYTATAFTSPGLPSLEKLFREEIPNISDSFPFLGHGMLSFAYVHLASLSAPETSKKLLIESAFHFNQALPGYLETINNINMSNSSALFGFAIFVVLISFANCSEESGILLQMARDQPHYKRDETIRGLAIVAARVARSIQNIFGIFWRCQQWISSGPLSPAIQRYIPPTINKRQIEWIRKEDECLAGLNSLWEDDPMVSLAHSCALSASLACLRDTFTMVTQLTVLLHPTDGEESEVDTQGNDLARIHRELSAGRIDDIQSVFTWYVRLSPEFIGLMEEGNAYAMVVLAHFAILLDRACSDRWWVHRLSQRFLAIAELVLGGDRREWIHWPLMVVTG